MKSSTTPRRGDLPCAASCGSALFNLFNLLRRTTGAVLLPNPYQGGLFLLAMLVSVLGYAQTTASEGQEPAYSPDMQKALAYVEQSEYFIRDQRATGALQSPNRAHNMRFTYKSDGFEAQPRVDSSLQWKIAFQVLGVYRGDTRLVAAASEAEATVSENRLVYEQAGYQVEYLNNQAGMRQNFIVAEKPAGSEPLTVKMAVESRHLQLACHNNELTGTQGGMVRYYYKDLRVWDARQNPLPATMQLQGNTLALVVDDRTATYPITIDPLSTTAAARVESNQAGAQMGISVASAGDVNGDGYSDVIVGADQYDNGESDEGAAFVYHGSASGISTTAAAQVESDQARDAMGISVASAGDVNGDGYSDVIVGAPFYGNGQTSEGAAFVYHGSAGGISTTAAAQVESDQDFALIGWSVASAGDVNGDGYSDVIVGAYSYDNGESDEGAAFVYHGNAGGGLRRNAGAFNTNTTTPIQQSNASANDFSLGLFSKSFLGSTKGKLVWEVKQQGEAFSSAGGSIANSVASTAEQGSFSNLGTSGTQLANAIDKAGTQTKVRVRVRYDPVTAITGQVYGPWQYLPEYTRGAQGMSSTPLLIPPLLTVAGNIKWSTDPNQGVKDATVTISGDAAGSGDSDADGNYSIDLYSGGNLTVTPVKNINKFNGVTAADATRIQQHATGNPLLGAPYPRIAADVNKNNSISVQDASLIKQALLGNPQANTLWNTSWRFVDADYVFLNPNVPWNFPESIALNGVNSSQTDVNFTGIKLGDVTTPAANPALRPEPLVLRTSDQRLQSGQIMAVPVSVEGFAHVAAFQFVLHFDADALALQHISTPEGGLLSLGDFGTYDAAQGEIRTVFAQPQGAEMTNGDVFFTLHFTPLQSGAWLSETIHLDASLLPAEAYTPDMEVKPIDLVFSQSSATGQLHDPKPALRAIPNPANDQTQLHFTLPVADEAFIRVINLNGKVLLAQRARYDAGAHVLPMTFTQAGVYMAELRTAKGVEVVKIVVE